MWGTIHGRRQSVNSKLKNNKAAGLDNVNNEMLTLARTKLLPFLTKLFNILLKTGKYPKTWKIAYITLLHKKGNKDSPENYRPLAITSCFSKPYHTVLNIRLAKYMEKSGLSNMFQGAFQNNSCS